MKFLNFEIDAIYILFFLFLTPIIYPTFKLFIKSLMLQSNITREILLFIENLSSEKNLPWFSNVIFLSVFFLLITIQNRMDVDFLRIDTSTFNSFSTYGFIIGLLSAYGIYLGFLQFIVNDSEKVRYFGKSKIKYLTETSPLYQLTQTKSFFVVAVLIIISPIIIEHTDGELQNLFIYAWQSSIIIFLWIYISLLVMSLKIIRILFLIKDRTDYGLELGIELSTVNEYEKYIKKVFKNDFKVIDDFISKLEFDISRVEKNQLGYFLVEVFGSLHRKSVLKYKKSFKEADVTIIYPKITHEKYGVLSRFYGELDWDTVEILVKQDISKYNALFSDWPDLIKKSESEFHIGRWYEIKNINEFLFQQLIRKISYNPEDFDKLRKYIQESTSKLMTSKRQKNQNDDLLEYYLDVERYRWKVFFEVYENIELQIDLPKFQNGSKEHDFYSMNVFLYLIGQHGKLEKDIINSFKLKKLFDSMNRRYKLSFLLYQIFYPNQNEWDNNLIYYLEQTSDLLNYLEPKEKCRLYQLSSKSVSETHIGHRIEYEVLETIFSDRKKEITKMSYFAKFNRTQLPSLLIIIVQGVLDPSNANRERMNNIIKESENEQRAVHSICNDMLHAIHQQPKFANFSSVTTTLDPLILDLDIDLNTSVDNVKIVGLLYYEYVLIKNNYSNDKIKGAFLDSIKFNNEMFFHSDSIFIFFMLKIINQEYEDVFRNKEFIAKFRCYGIKMLDRKDMELEEFIKQTYMKVKEAKFSNIGLASMRIIYSKINKILFDI